MEPCSKHGAVRFNPAESLCVFADYSVVERACHDDFSQRFSHTYLRLNLRENLFAVRPYNPLTSVFL